MVVSGYGESAKSDSLDPQAYLATALNLIETKALHTPKAHWSAVRSHAEKLAADAQTPADTYPAIQYAVDRLQAAGDQHAGFISHASSSNGQPSSPPAQLPTVSLGDSRVGVVNLTSILESAPNTTRYERATLSIIVSLHRREHVCGWIVDVRGDGGGDMYPMLLAIGPILGSGRVIGFLGRNSSDPTWISYRSPTLSGFDAPSPPPRSRLHAEDAGRSADRAKHVELRGGCRNRFRGRPHARSFGATTGGATNSPGFYRLADGATVAFTSYWDVDRTGRVYRSAVRPDVSVRANYASGDTQLRAATRWLQAQPQCATRR